jgi:hypothetical protein
MSSILALRIGQTLVRARSSFLVALLACVLSSGVALAQQGHRWVRMEDIPESSGKMVYDASRERVVWLGSSGRGTATWEWVGVRWSERATSASPQWSSWSASSEFALAYDELRRRVVCFAGSARETWLWDGSDWSRAQPSISPEARWGHAMAFDRRRGRVVLFGGGESWNGLRADTWEWDGVTWMRLDPLPLSPLERSGHAMVYDAARGVVLLHGGYHWGQSVADTWAWDGLAWTQVGSGGLSVERADHELAYDEARRVVMLVGGVATKWWEDRHGYDGGWWVSHPQDGTWEWDGIGWSYRSAANLPGRWTDLALAHDRARNRTIVFGGYDEQWIVQSDTWEWNGSRWIRVSRRESGPERGSPMAHDLARRRIVCLDEKGTWEWDGQRWERREETPQAGRIPAPGGHMAYDEARRRVVYFGGHDRALGVYPQDTWEWDGDRWSHLLVTGPSGRSGHAMAYDAARRRIVLFGGWGNAPYDEDVWEWDGSSWSRRITSNAPGLLAGAAMAFDPIRARVVLFGGVDLNLTPSSITWEWDGQRWSRAAPSGSIPPARWGHALAFDPGSGSIVLDGGLRSNWHGELLDTWRWDGTTWTELPTAGGPLWRTGHLLTYLEERASLVVPGASDSWLLSEDPARIDLRAPACRVGVEELRLASDVPRLGHGAFRMELFSAAPNTIAVFGFSDALAPQPIGACVLHLREPLLPLPAIADARGIATSPALAIPGDPALRGMELFVQGFAFEAPLAGPRSSRALALHVGDGSP